MEDFASSNFSAQSAAGLRAECIRDARRLAELAPMWKQLWSAQPQLPPFQSPEWLLPWWENYGEGELLSFAFWNREQLAGFAPLYVYPEPASEAPNTARKNRLLLIGTGNSDYLDALFLPQWRNACLSLLWAEVEASAQRWEECNFERLAAGSPLLDLQANFGALRVEERASEPTAVLDLSSEKNPGRVIQRAERFKRWICNSADCRFEQADAHSFEEIFSALEALHQSRWEAKFARGVFARERDRAFHRSAAGNFLGAGMLRLYALRIGGKIASVIYAFVRGSRLYFYSTGFDAEFARLSPGRALLAHVILEAKQEGCSRLDFLRGEESYKIRWGAQAEPVFSLRVRKGIPENPSVPTGERAAGDSAGQE